ncbi:unnamed protein product [Mucor hiemalis]
MTNWLEDSIDDPNLRQSVEDLIKAYPASARVLERMARYYDNKPSDREAKRRKVEESNLSSDEVFRLIDISFQLPARKKYNLIITRTRLLLHNPKTDIIEFQCNLNDISPYGGSCVPSPDKATKCNTFTLFLKNEDCLVFNSQDKVDMVLKKPDTADEVLGENKHEIISKLLTQHARVTITQPSKEFFRSTGVSSTTGKVLEDKTHVVAYLKAKDGFLFFLPTGILFGFKKPTLFFPISSLASTVITNITQRTFDLTLTMKPGSQILGSSGFRTTKEGDDDTVQFSMIEQSEYGGIEAYTKKSGVNDHSMAEERKAVVPSKKEDDEKKATKGDEDEDSEENDEDFQPSDDDNEPLEYDTDADEEEADRELASEEQHEFEDAMSEDEEDEDEEQDLLDEDDD